MSSSTPLVSQVGCYKVKEGKKTSWEAKHPTVPTVVGAGKTANAALKNWQEQFRQKTSAVTVRAMPAVKIGG